MSFETDLIVGKKFENKAAELLREHFKCEVFITQGLFGADIFINLNGQTEGVEVKYQSKHGSTGNVGYEIANMTSFKISGLAATRCVWWVDVVEDNGFFVFYLIKVPQLRALIVKLLKSGKAFTANGGDGNCAVMVCTHFTNILTDFDIIGSAARNNFDAA